MRRAPSLHVWLGLALAFVIAVPALAGLAAWAVAGSWQASREEHRHRQALSALRGVKLDDSAERDAVIRRLTALGVDAQLEPNPAGVKVALGCDPRLPQLAGTGCPAALPRAAGGPGAEKAKGLTTKPVVVTPGLETGDAKLRTQHERQFDVNLPNVVGVLWVPRESAATRWSIALGAGLVMLAAALVVVVVLLRRWVLRPLAQLATDAQRIAGGELDVEPLPTRAREVAEVGDALHGMAGGLRAALGSSQAAERDRRFMITAIAHDLRTPLFTLRGSLEALERGVGGGRYLCLARDKAAHLDRLVSDLFAFSRLEDAQETIAFDTVDVGELAHRAAEGVEPLARTRGGAVVVGDVQRGLVVRGDADALLRVLTNLLDNAIRHGRGRVFVGARRVDGGVRVEVADDGPGFAPDDLPHVFEPLFRSDRARAAATGGTGLGLAIARRLARAHGGDVEAANDPGGGARTTLTLPPA
jgi:signal transduction histidine kinase